MAEFDSKQFITQARAKGIPDEQTFNYLKGKGLIPDTQAKTTTPTIEAATQPGFAQKVGQGAVDVVGAIGKGAMDLGTGAVNAFTQSEQEFGKDIGKSFYLMSGGQKSIDQTSQNFLDSGDGLVKAAKKATDPERKKRLLEMATQDFKDGGMTSESIIGAIKSNEQYLGDAAGTLVDILSAGSYGKATAGFKSGKLLQEAPKATKAMGIGAKIASGAKTGAQIGTAYGAGKGFSEGLATGQDALGVAESTGGGALIGLAGGTVLGAGGGLVSGAFSKLFESGAVKNVADYEAILKTPESEVSKLGPEERNAWYANQHSIIEDKAMATKKDISSKLDSDAKMAQQTTDELERELSTASRDKVLALRPKILEAFGKQSAIYRKLFDEDIADKKNVAVNSGQLNKFVDTLFADNPAKGESIKGILNIPKGEEGSTTIGKIINQMKSLKGAVSSGVKKGSKVFTSEEKNNDDAINVLSKYLKSEGVDLSKSNQFWAEYAPVRDQLAKEAKPFLQADIGTETFAKTLIDVAKGKDINNENFIAEVENILGEKILGENKRVLQKMSQAQKWQLAQKNEAEMLKEEVAMQKEVDLGKLDKTKFEIERVAARKKIFKDTLKWFGITAGGAVAGAKAMQVAGKASELIP